MAEGTDHCVEQAQWAVRLAGPQVSSKVSFLLRYIYLTRVHSTSPIPGRAYMRLTLRFSDGDELSTRRQEGYVLGHCFYRRRLILPSSARPDGHQQDSDIVKILVYGEPWGPRASTDPDSWQTFQRTTDSGKRHSRLLRFSRTAAPFQPRYLILLVTPPQPEH